MVLWEDAFLVCFAAAATDVAAWCGGRGLRRFGWARRPLSQSQLTYALGDVVHLRDIYEYLKAELEREGRAGWVEE